jgi:hypothetical protein
MPPILPPSADGTTCAESTGGTQQVLDSLALIDLAARAGNGAVRSLTPKREPESLAPLRCNRRL